jgi:hypothetical protein
VKAKLQQRIVRKTLEIKKDITTFVESAVGEYMTGESSNCGRIRRLYTTSYKSLDQFDQLWYECCYDKRDRNWVTCYAWALILDCFINARSAYCEARGEAEPLKEFIRVAIDEIRDFIVKQGDM